MSDTLQVVELVEGKHWRIINNIGERIELELDLPDATKIITEMEPEAVFHLIPGPGAKLLNVTWRRFAESRLRLV